MAYSIDFRRRAVEYYHEGSTQEEVSKVFKISRATLRDWEKRYKTGDLKANYPKMRKGGKLPPDKLIRFIEENPDTFLPACRSTRRSARRRREEGRQVRNRYSLWLL